MLRPPTGNTADTPHRRTVTARQRQIGCNRIAVDPLPGVVNGRAVAA